MEADPEGNNKSKAKISFGSFEQSDNCPTVHLCVDFNKDIANSTTETLKGYGIEDKFTEFTVCVVASSTEGRADDLKSCLDKVMGDETYEGHFLKPLRKEICKTSGPHLSYKSYKTDDDKVIGCFKIPEEVGNMDMVR